MHNANRRVRKKVSQDQGKSGVFLISALVIWVLFLFFSDICIHCISMRHIFCSYLMKEGIKLI